MLFGTAQPAQLGALLAVTGSNMQKLIAIAAAIALLACGIVGPLRKSSQVGQHFMLSLGTLDKRPRRARPKAWCSDASPTSPDPDVKCYPA